MANEVVIHVKGDAKDAEKNIQSFTDKIKASTADLTKMGAGLLGFGAALTAGLTLAVKSAAEEEAGIAKLSQALKNVGVSYDAVSASLEATIEATQQKTSVADDAQREALAALVGITGDYSRSLSLMSLTMDLAAAKGIDMKTAAEVIGRVSEGNTTILTRYGVQLKEGATATEALAALTQKFGGQAEKMGSTVAGQMKLLKANFGDAAEALGNILLPVISKMTETLNKLVLWFKGLSPEMQKTIAIGTAVTGIFSVLGGAFLLLLSQLPSLILGFKALAVIGPIIGSSFHAALGPIGIITASISAAIAVGILLAKNWDTVKRAMQVAVNAMMGALEWFVNGYIRGFNLLIKGINAYTSAISFGAIPAIKEIAEIQLPRLEVSAKKTAEGGQKAAQTFASGYEKARENIEGNLKKTQEELEKHLKEVLEQTDKFGGQLIFALKARNESMEAAETASIQKRIDLQKDLNDSQNDLLADSQRQVSYALQDISEAYRKSLTKEKEALKDAFDAKKDLYESDALARIGALNIQTAQQLKGYHDQIAILEATGEAEEKAEREKENAARRMEITEQLRIARGSLDAEKTKKIEKELAAFDLATQEEANKRWRREDRRNRIEAIQTMMDSIRERATEVEKGIRADQATKIKAAEDELKDKIKLKDALISADEEQLTSNLRHLEENTRNRKIQLNKQFEDTKLHLNEELETTKLHFKSLNTEESLQAEARKLVIENNNDEIIALLDSYNPKWQDAGQSFGQKLIEGLNSEKAGVQAAVNEMLSLVSQASAPRAIVPQTSAPQIITPEQSLRRAVEIATGAAITPFQQGGIVTRPTLALLGERGPEMVTPLGRSMAGSTANIAITIVNRGIIGVDDLDKHIFQAIRDGKRRGAFQGVIP